MIRARLSERVTRARAVTVSGRGRLEIVWIDQTPLRANAAAECTDMMMRLERARLGWHQFERQDKPAFVRWRAREFGALLSNARDVADKRYQYAAGATNTSRLEHRWGCVSLFALA